ncbi:MAG: hypothetical protein EA408_02690 [Marinilabiliales bacterium]|nr:MAG: hypothetical protein EA408_02690 [Marinilabiliales bacterium]
MLKAGLIGKPAEAGPDFSHPRFHLTGYFCPPGQGTGTEADPDHFLPPVSNEALLLENDALIFLYADNDMMGLITEAVKMSRHILIWNADRLDLDDIRRLIKLRDEADNVVHIRRFGRSSPLLRSSLATISHPSMFSLKKAFTPSYPENGNPVFHRHLLTAIDALLYLCPGNIKKINTMRQKSGMASTGLLSTSLYFENGSAANLLVSDISGEDLFVIEAYQANRLVKINIGNQKVDVFERNGRSCVTAQNKETPGITTEQLTHCELENFSMAIEGRTPSVDQLYEMARLREICREIVERSGYTC